MIIKLLGANEFAVGVLRTDEVRRMLIADGIADDGICEHRRVRFGADLLAADPAHLGLPHSSSFASSHSKMISSWYMSNSPLSPSPPDFQP